MQKLFLVLITLLFFASNSILCRLALAKNLIDAYSFTLIRIFSGVIVLSLIVLIRNRGQFKLAGKFSSGFFLILYALLFSLAYLKIPAATGALILFGSVQITMIGWSLFFGAGPEVNEWIGFILATLGLVYLLFPGIKAPDPRGALYMGLAGVGWGAYSILGKKSQNPILDTAGNFTKGLLLLLPTLILASKYGNLSEHGIELAIISGAITSGLGYSIWYTVLPKIKSTQAAILQLLVPVIAAVMGAIILHETISSRLLIAGFIIVIGILITIKKPLKKKTYPLPKSQIRQ